MDIDFESLLATEKESKELEKKSGFTSVLKNAIPKNASSTPWLFNGVEISDIPDKFKDHVSFVYLITNKVNKKRYVGFKSFISKIRKIVSQKKKTVYVESDWKDYYGSSHELLSDVGKYGKGSFIREIVAFTYSKPLGKYYEILEQLNRGVLTGNADKYYNGIINVRLNKTHLKDFDKIVRANRLLGDEICGD